MKTILITALRVLALTIIFIVLFTTATTLTIPPEIGTMLMPEQTNQMAVGFPLVCFLMTVLLAYTALRSRWHGWKLAGALFVIFYGVYTFLSQIESAVFAGVASRLPEGMLGGFFIGGLILTIPFSVLAVWILGKTNKDPLADEPNDRLIMPNTEWAWKMATIVVMYEIIYFSFGYYVAWRTPGLPEFYGGVDPGSFIGQIGNMLRDTPWLPFFQIFRAFIWTCIGGILIRMHKGKLIETGLSVGFAFSILMSAFLLLPNPIMGPVVARAHFYEVSTSNLLFGFLMTMLLLWKPTK